MSSPIVILAGARTPIGKLSGLLASFSATEHGGFAIRAALDRAGLTGRADRLRLHGPRGARVPMSRRQLLNHLMKAGAGALAAAVGGTGWLRRVRASSSATG